MVAPVAHKGDLADLDDAESAALMRALGRTIHVLRERSSPRASTSAPISAGWPAPASRTTSTFTSFRVGTAIRTSCR